MKLALVIGSAVAVIVAASRTDVAPLIASASQAPAAAAQWPWKKTPDRHS